MPGGLRDDTATVRLGEGIKLLVERLSPGRDTGIVCIQTLVVSKLESRCKDRNTDCETPCDTVRPLETVSARGIELLSQKRSFLRQP